ncbi:hypothetical protein QVD17_36942 [Tagetes erecta]|uniref:Cupin type-1 domain-containing protein n=1 Tax=Tagetes erecta TaxID=13708 RepID=A0AAD8JT72_TARER|nr:hypothetical protein QVD17_36942 [Tagetes erecta]
MRVNFNPICLVLLASFVPFIFFPQETTALGWGRGGGGGAGPVPVSDGPTVRKDERWPLVSSEFGDISAVKISDHGENGCYYLHFINMYPASLLLPVYLNSQMLLYVNSGSGTLSWINVEKNDDKLQQVTLKRGDVFRLSTETVFYLQNNVDKSYAYQPQNLQIYAIFPGSEYKLHNDQLVTAYTPVRDLVLGFDNQVLQSTLNVPEEVIEELRGGEEQPLIVDGQSEVSTSMWDTGSWGIKALLGTNSDNIFNVANKMKAYNIFKEGPDIETCFGWSVSVSSKELDVLKYTDFGVFMVNLTKGSMMEPHWNPNSVEVAIVLHGQGVIEVVCPGIVSETECKNSRLRVEEGDVFVVPRDQPMAQISFNNDSFVFMGFMLTQKKENPQYLAGKLSILQRLDRKVLAKSFNVRNTTIDWVLSNKKKDIIYECVSCAEEQVSWKSKGGGGGEGRQEEEGRRGGGSRRQEEREGGGGSGWQGEGGGRQEEERGARREWQEERGGGGEWQDQEGRGEGGGWKGM